MFDYLQSIFFITLLDFLKLEFVNALLYAVRVLLSRHGRTSDGAAEKRGGGRRYGRHIGVSNQLGWCHQMDASRPVRTKLDRLRRRDDPFTLSE